MISDNLLNFCNFMAIQTDVNYNSPRTQSLDQEKGVWPDDKKVHKMFFALFICDILSANKYDIL